MRGLGLFLLALVSINCSIAHEPSKPDVIRLLKDAKSIVERLYTFRKEDKDTKISLKLKAFEQTWVASWTGIPSLAMDYVKHWFEGDDKTKLKAMKDSCEKFAHEIGRAYEAIDKKTTPDAKRMEMKKWDTRLHKYLKAMFNNFDQVFTSGYIHDCLRHLRAAIDTPKLFEDLFKLNHEELQSLLHLLGQPMRYTPDSKDEL